MFDLRDELLIFLKAAKPELAVHFQNFNFVSRQAYLVHIFEASKQLNLKMQGKEKYIFQFVDFANAFVEKLRNRKR